MHGGQFSTYAYVGDNPLSLIDPTGLADLNLFDPDPQSHDSHGTYEGGNAGNIPGVYTVAGHENPINMDDRRNGTGHAPIVYPKDLAAMIKPDPKWNDHTPVMLGGFNIGNDAVHQGRDTFAQQLADLLGVPVTAAQGFTQWSATQRLVGTSDTINGSIPNPGKWRAFYPR